MSLGARYHRTNNKKKISGADMLPGILLAIAYDKCPVNYQIYIEEETNDFIVIDWDNLAALIDELAKVLNKEFKSLSLGSAKQYLHALRRGRRANNNGELPPLNVMLSQSERSLKIPKRNYSSDILKYKDLPEWIF